MKIRTQTTLSGFGLMLLADAARVFDLRVDTGQLPPGKPAPPLSEGFDQTLAESAERMARRALPKQVAQ